MSKEATAQLPFGVGGGLVAIKTLLSRDPCVHSNTAIQMIDAILTEQPAQQEPVAWMTKDGEIYKHECWPEYEARPLVFGDTSPPAQRTWVGLTDEEIDETHETKVWDARRSYARAIEAKLKEKNT